jgi:hypothetical protein
MRSDHELLHRHLRHRRQILERVVGHARAQAGIDHVRGDHDAERVAVGRGLGHRVGADHGARAGFVLDDHRLAPHLLHLGGDQPADDIGRAAGRERDDQTDGLDGKLLCR